MPISFTNVFYTYSPKSPLAFAALKDINVTIEDHSFTALIGQTGSGKSTLINLVPRFYDATDGEVLVDGVNKSFTYADVAIGDVKIYHM